MSGIRLRWMPRLLVVSALLAAALAFPASGQETPPATTTDDVPVMVESATTTDAEPVYDATVVPAPEPILEKDSPLVAASKLARRNKKKSTTRVITNATVKQPTPHAHITTTKTQKPVVVPKPAKSSETKPAKTETSKSRPRNTSATSTPANGDADQELFGDEDDASAPPPQAKPPHR